MIWTTFPLFPVLAGGACGCGNPSCKNAGKHPSVPWGKNALRAGQQIPIPPGCGVGVATGSRSGLLVVDLDRKKGVDGVASLRRLGELPETVGVATPSGGFHVYLQYPDFTVGNSVSMIGPGIDIRGEGGYVVMPPSLHENGGRYEWLRQGPVAAAPEWLLNMLREGKRAAIKSVTSRDLEDLSKNWRRRKGGEKDLADPLQKVALGEAYGARPMRSRASAMTLPGASCARWRGSGRTLIPTAWQDASSGRLIAWATTRPASKVCERNSSAPWIAPSTARELRIDLRWLSRPSPKPRIR
jgi:hypothetical protein